MIRARCALAAALALAACSGPADRLGEAVALRHAHRPAEALAAYRELLADLGDARLPADLAAVRLRALQGAADVAYLELGEYAAAIAYYRRLVALDPDGEGALRARAAIGDIYRDRLGDPVAAIAQYAGIAAGGSAEAPRYQLEVARGYLALGNREQARVEAEALAARWPSSPAAGEARLVAAQALAQSGQAEAALALYAAAAEAAGPGALAARAREEAAHLHAQEGRLDRALALYEAALPGHPNPDAVRAHVAAVARRRAAAGVARPGDRAAAFK